MVRSKKKGFILLDVLLSISLIFIVASLLIPAITNLLLARNKLKQRSELYQVSKNQIELITSAAYMGSDKYEIIIPEKYKYRYKYRIEKENLGDNLVRYFLYIEDEDKGEIKFEKILQKKRLYSNWTCCINRSYFNGIYNTFDNFSKYFKNF